MTLWNLVFDAFFPTRCVGCRLVLSRGATICSPCFTDLPRATTLFCGRCLARRADRRSLCHADHPYLFGAATDYRAPAVRALICDLKFRSRRDAVEPLVALLIEYAERVLRADEPCVVVPVPLARERERARGFNQAALLARPLAEHFHFPLAEHLLIRRRLTKPQSELRDAAARRTNVRDCFVSPEPIALSRRTILLIDDVRTSGATLEEAARTLRRAGARHVLALTVARAT